MCQMEVQQVSLCVMLLRVFILLNVPSAATETEACNAIRDCGGHGTTSDQDASDGCDCVCTEGYESFRYAEHECSVPPPTTMPYCDVIKETVGDLLPKDWTMGFHGRIDKCSSDDTFENFQDKCETFCGDGTVPVTMGTRSAALTYDEMEEICLGKDVSEPLMKPDPTALIQCRQYQGDFDALNKAMGRFIALFETLKTKQVHFAAEIADGVKKIKVALKAAWDPETGAISKEGSSRKLAKLQEVFKNEMTWHLRTNNVAKQKLQASVQGLKDQGDALLAAVNAVFAKIDYMIDKCMSLMPATTVGNMYLLDICSTNSYTCLDHGQIDGLHVGCCCGIVPAVGVYAASGEGACTRPDSPPGTDCNGRRLHMESASRKLQGEPMQGASDACVVAQSMLEALTEEVRVDMSTANYDQSTMDQLDVLDARFESLQCPSNRRLKAGVPARVPASNASRQAVHSEFEHNARRLSCANKPPQQTQSLAGGVRLFPTYSLVDLEHPSAEQTPQCMQLGANESEARTILEKQCDAFCGSAVPIQVGSTVAGFDHEQIDNICLQPDGELYDQTQMNRCHDLLAHQGTLATSIARFAAASKGAELAQIAAQAHVVVAVAKLKETLKNNVESTLINANVGEKGKDYIALFDAAKKDLMNSDNGVRAMLQEKYRLLAAAAGAASTALTTFVDETDEFQRDCDGLSTGVDSAGHYLLDQCSVSSQQCLSDQRSERLACCCGYTPMSRLGQTKFDWTGTIPGFAAVEGGRRMADDTAVICEETASQVQPIATELLDDLDKLNQPELITPYKNRIMEGYCKIPSSGGSSGNIGDHSGESATNHAGDHSGESATDHAGRATKMMVAVFAAMVHAILNVG